MLRYKKGVYTRAVAACPASCGSELQRAVKCGKGIRTHPKLRRMLHFAFSNNRGRLEVLVLRLGRMMMMPFCDLFLLGSLQAMARLARVQRRSAVTGHFTSWTPISMTSGTSQ